MDSSKEVTIELQAKNDSNDNFNDDTKCNSFDQADMRRMGRDQQLRRNFHSFSILGLTLRSDGYLAQHHLVRLTV